MRYSTEGGPRGLEKNTRKRSKNEEDTKYTHNRIEKNSSRAEKREGKAEGKTQLYTNEKTFAICMWHGTQINLIYCRNANLQKSKYVFISFQGCCFSSFRIYYEGGWREDEGEIVKSSRSSRAHTVIKDFPRVTRCHIPDLLGQKFFPPFQLG